MKALAFTEFGSPEKLALRDVPDPTIGPDDMRLFFAGRLQVA